MVRVVPVEAPRNFTADLTFRKGSPADSSLPIVVRRSEVESDYPHLTGDLARLVGKNQSWTARAAAVLNLKGDSRYHQQIRSSKSGVIHRYSDAALAKLRSQLEREPDFNPYRIG